MEYNLDELDIFFVVKYKDFTEYESIYYEIKRNNLIFYYYIYYLEDLIKIKIIYNDERTVILEVNLSKVDKIVKCIDGGIDILYSEGKRVHIDNEPNFSVTCGSVPFV